MVKDTNLFFIKVTSLTHPLNSKRKTEYSLCFKYQSLDKIWKMSLYTLLNLLCC